MPEQPWADKGGGFPRDDNALAWLLRPYDIEPHRISISGVQRHGYRRGQFKDVLETWGQPQDQAA